MAEKATVAAVSKALEGAKKRNFRETVDLAINLKDIDLSLPKNRIQEDIILPHGRGKDVRICVIGGGELALKAKNVADLVITPEELGAIADDKKEAKRIANSVDYFIAEAPLMPTVGKRLGTVLGPRGKMPKPIPPGADPTGMIDSLRRSVTIRTKDKKTFHAPVGTVDMDPEDIADNIETVLKRVEARLEKGKSNIASSYVKTTMGPAVRVV
ncbi:MAG: large subunit ribosomal protein [Candidatus Methanomethylophilaceae archaeon]|nr:large subunit ribosomal protein [Candidatus Methanomethylophilaceae archaeon]MDI3541351.1 large subunit ribosomal protein [Candidatus Methanomethylophilaceae archaeon]